MILIIFFFFSHHSYTLRKNYPHVEGLLDSIQTRQEVVGILTFPQ